MCVCVSSEKPLIHNRNFDDMFPVHEYEFKQNKNRKFNDDEQFFESGAMRTFK